MSCNSRSHGCDSNDCCESNVVVMTQNALLKVQELNLNTLAIQEVSGLPDEWVPERIFFVAKTGAPITTNAIGAFYIDSMASTQPITQETDDFSGLTGQITRQDLVFVPISDVINNTIYFRLSSINGSAATVDAYIYGRDLKAANASLDACNNACKVVSIPGPRGKSGGDGKDGYDGINAYTFTTASFVVPPVNSTVNVSVLESSWMSATGLVGQPVYIGPAGTYEVISKPNNASFTAKNLGYPNNAIVGTVIASGSQVSPTGIKGDDALFAPPVAIALGGTGQITASDAFDALAPTTVQGAISYRTSTTNVELVPATPNSVLHSGTSPYWGAVDLLNDTTGITPVVKGGTGGNTAAAARLSLGVAASGNNNDITQLTGLTTPLTIAQGGTSANTGTAARTNIGAAASGVNSDITSLTGLTSMPAPATRTSGVVALNFGAIAATSQGTINVAVVGAALNDGVSIGWSAAIPAGVVFVNAFVSAVNQVTIVLYNTTGAPIGVATTGTVNTMRFV